MAKKVLKRKIMTVAANAPAWEPVERPMPATIMARPIPPAFHIIRRRLPSRSTTKRATRAARKYSVPRTPVRSRAKVGSKPRESSKTTVASVQISNVFGDETMAKSYSMSQG